MGRLKMWLFGTLLAVVSAQANSEISNGASTSSETAAVVCDSGFATGINQYGQVDASNTQTCYLTSQAARVTSCNNGDIPSMRIAVLKSFYDETAGTTETPAGYTLDGNDYIREFTVDRGSLSLVDESDGNQVDASQCLGTDNLSTCASDEVCMRDSGSLSYSCQAKDVRFSRTVAISANGSDSDGDGVNIFFDHSVQIEFTCRYTLATQTVTSEQNVSGVDQVYNREQSGKFSFSMALAGDDSIQIGQTRSFSISPTQTGLIYASVEQCTVRSGENSYQLMRGNSFAEMCTDWATNFVNTDNPNTWSSDSTMSFSYRAFRWNTSGQTIEAQTIECSLKLNFSQQTAYNPNVCS